jgi:hypothetical protein
MHLRHLLFVLLLAAFATSGCIFSPDDDSGGDPPPPVEFVPAESPDEVMQKFEEIYEDRNLDFYRELLSEGYLFVPQDDAASYGYEVEINILDKMFNEIAGENGFVIQDISVVQLDPQGVWQDTPANDPNFGSATDSQYRTYIVQIDFSIAGQNLILRVQGPVIYYVRAEQDGDQTVYRLLGMVDATFGS